VLVLLLVGLAPVLIHAAGFNMGLIPWSVILLLGTTVALVAGFKNTQIYNRSVEAQQVWSAIVASSRIWGTLCQALQDLDAAKCLIHRHVAWLTAMRFALRSPRAWETAGQKANLEFGRRFRILEQESSLQEEIGRHVSVAEETIALDATNPAAQILQLQSADVGALLNQGRISPQSYGEMFRTLRDLYDLQARCERIKDSPYPRQYAVVSALFVSIFCILLPFGLIGQFEQLNDGASGWLQGHMVWLVVPFSVVIGWMYAALDQVGESTANPFEGGANDVPISQISRSLERELRAFLREGDLPPALAPVNGILT
jgi:putative membrane protein